MGACPTAGLCWSCERPLGLMAWHRALVSFVVAQAGSREAVGSGFEHKRHGRDAPERGLRSRKRA